MEINKIKINYNYLLLGLLAVPIFAYLDLIFIGALGYADYVIVCLWEYMIFLIGVLVGIKIFKRNQ